MESKVPGSVPALTALNIVQPYSGEYMLAFSWWVRGARATGEGRRATGDGRRAKGSGEGLGRRARATDCQRATLTARTTSPPPPPNPRARMRTRVTCIITSSLLLSQVRLLRFLPREVAVQRALHRDQTLHVEHCPLHAHAPLHSPPNSQPRMPGRRPRKSHGAGHCHTGPSWPIGMPWPCGLCAMTRTTVLRGWRDGMRCADFRSRKGERREGGRRRAEWYGRAGGRLWVHVASEAELGRWWWGGGQGTRAGGSGARPVARRAGLAGHVAALASLARSRNPGAFVFAPRPGLVRGGGRQALGHRYGNRAVFAAMLGFSRVRVEGT